MTTNVSEIHKPLCYRGIGTRCTSAMAVKEKCQSCRTCPLRPEGL